MIRSAGRIRTGWRLTLGALALLALTPASARSLDDTRKALDRAQTELMRNPAAAVAQARATRAQAATLPPGADRIMALARADWLLGAGLAGLNQPKEALVNLRRGLEGGILRVAPKSKLAGDLYMAQSIALTFDNNVVAALPLTLRAHDIYRALGEKRSEAISLQTVGSIYLVARDFDRALRYYAEASDTFSGDPALTISLLNSRGTALMEQGRYADAAGFFAQALDRARTMKSDVLLVRFSASLARAQLQAGQLDQAESNIRTAFALAQGTRVGDWMPALYWTSAEIARKRGRLDQAANLIDQTFAGVKLDQATLAMRDYLRTAYEIYKARGDQRTALRYFEAYKRTDDQARAVAASAAAALMSARFDFQGQQQRISTLRANEKIQAAAAEAKLRSTLLNAVLVAASLIVGLLSVAFFSIRRSRNEVRAANTELSSTNVQLEQALAARTQFLAMTSHEIRTPLNGILGMTQVLLADRGIETGVRGKIELVHGAGETMKALVDDLLDVAKMTNGEVVIHKEEMDLARLLRDVGQVAQAQAQTRGLGFALEAGDVPARIVEDEVRLRQIVANLTTNAIKFTDQGQVRVTAEMTEREGVERLRIAIADTGIGIPPDKLEEIFESFRQVDSGTTRRHSGTGLGLAICRSLARAMGGDVLVQSIEGVGSTFTVDLPLERAAAPAVAPERKGLAAAKLLVVEANPLTQSVLRAVLGARVAEISTAANADDARTALAGDRPDIILADAGSLGLDVAAAIALGHAAHEQGVRFALTWAAPDDAIRSALAQAGIDLVAKPIAPPDLAAAIDTIYNGSNPALPASVAA